jgi:hypothetical protein
LFLAKNDDDVDMGCVSWKRDRERERRETKKTRDTRRDDDKGTGSIFCRAALFPQCLCVCTKGDKERKNTQSMASSSSASASGGDPRCARLRQPATVANIRAAVLDIAKCRPGDIEDMQLHDCTIAADGATEATLVVPIRNTGKVYSFRVATDNRNRATSIRLEAVHVNNAKGYDGKMGAGGAGSMPESTKERITKAIWISIAVILVVAVVVAVIVVVVKKKKEAQEKVAAIAQAAKAFSA